MPRRDMSSCKDLVDDIVSLGMSDLTPSSAKFMSSKFVYLTLNIGMCVAYIGESP